MKGFAFCTFSWLVAICVVVLTRNSNGLAVSFNDVTEVLRLGREVVVDVLESWELIRQRLPGADNEENDDFPFVKRMEKELRNRISVVSRKIDDYQEKMELKTERILMQLLLRLPVEQQLQSDLRELNRNVEQIDDLYALFEEYSVPSNKYETYTLQDFAKSMVSPQLGAFPDVLKNIHRLFVPSRLPFYNRSILVTIANNMQEASNQICNEDQSPQQLLYNLYGTIALTEIKGYAMMQFSYILLRLYNKGSNFTEEMHLLKQQYAERTTETLRAVKTAMAFAPRDLWKCDPLNYKLDETYTELKELFQGFIINEVDLNNDFSCRENCGYYGYAKMQGCYQNLFCSQQRKCNGKILNCEYIDSDMWICLANSSNSRRYEYIEYENGRIFGQKNTCKNNVKKVDSWWRWLFWHCSYCFCYCDDFNSSSDRYFNLREVVADIANNKVITGVRMIKKNKIIHIQIQEGLLHGHGSIEPSSISWKPVEDYTIFDLNYKNGIDYHTLVWEKRGLDMDDLISPENHVLTGIKFRLIGTRLNLEIRVTPFNYTTGKLIQPLQKSFWLSNDITDRAELTYSNPDIPIRSVSHSPDSKVNQYLNFAPSDRVKDAAQSTIPFLDIQPIQPKPPVPLSGAGIFHKGRKGSGGFVSLKLITYDFAPHLQTELPPSPPIIENYKKIPAV